MKTTWHTVLSFNPNSNTYLQTVPKGALVYVEAAYELREPEPEADPESPQGQRQIFLRHGEFLASILAEGSSHLTNALRNDPCPQVPEGRRPGRDLRGVDRLPSRSPCKSCPDTMLRVLWKLYSSVKLCLAPSPLL